MSASPKPRQASLLLLALIAFGCLWAADSPSPQQRRERALAAHKAGNYKVAYDLLRPLLLDPRANPAFLAADFNLAVSSLRSLGRVDEFDALLEASVSAHPRHWQLLQAAALSFRQVESHGYLVAGQFYRGYRRGTGRFVNVAPRDRLRALQLMTQAMPLVLKADKADAAQFYLHFASLVLRGTRSHEAWRLQDLSDLRQLPDYEEGYSYGGSSRGAAVDEKNQPVYHHVPKTYADAQSDGQRWRYLLTQAVEMDSSLAGQVDLQLAQFCRSQYGVQTLAHWGIPRQPAAQEKEGTFTLHTLTDNQTIARLATGIQRFTLPDEFNWIHIYRRVAQRGKSSWGEQARDALAQEFEDRRQYVKAAAAWKQAIAEYGPGPHNHRKSRLEQIEGNWVRFEPGQVQPAGTRAVVDFRYRNGKKVTLEAVAIKVEQLLTDVQAYLQANPARVDWNQVNLGDLGHRLVSRNESKYLGEKVASWTQTLNPRPAHVDDRITLTTPLDRPGAYLLRAQLDQGNTSQIIVWIADTVLLKKQLDGQAYYFVADAVTGAPVPAAQVEYFGWRSVQVAPQKNQWRVETRSFKKTADRDGQVFVSPAELPSNHNWLVVARQGAKLAYLGFNSIWFGRRYDPEYNATRTFVMTDRPVYRPASAVHFKAWIRHAKYDQADTSDFAQRDFVVTIRNGKGDKVYEQTHRTDEYAGLEGTWTLPREATLGVYHVQVGDHWNVGHFRVEEYKKPEFEVKVEAPKEPIRLGEKITATLEAKYYFGAPVSKARVKYKVLRSKHETTWYPSAAWDWFYGPGYWWFASDYDWYPGWRSWGCVRPAFRWWHGWQRHEPPEVVLENEVVIGADGQVKITIDTKAAQELHPDQDHSYQITAEVTDESRRTITGTGKVIASRQPYQVFAWVDRGYYRVGDTLKASFRGLTPDRQAVVGKGKLTLWRISYDGKGKPSEQAVQNWEVATDAQGYVQQQIKAARAGQYRLALRLKDSKGHEVEGAYVVVVRGETNQGQDYRFNAIEVVPDRKEYAPGEKAKLLINTNTLGGTVLLFARPTNGVYQKPRIIRLEGKSTLEELALVQKDMPNVFVEAVTVHGGKVHTEVRELVVPPQKRVLQVEVKPDRQEYRPGQQAKVQVKVTDFDGKPFVGTTVLTVYDRAVEYISGGSNVPEIREFFWKWRRSHYPQSEHSLSRYLGNLLRPNQVPMHDLGVFGASVVEELASAGEAKGFGRGGVRLNERQSLRRKDSGAMNAAMAGRPSDRLEKAKDDSDKDAVALGDDIPPANVEPTIRKNFADTAFWKGNVTTNSEGLAEVTFPLPQQLTGWKIKVWGMGHGTRVGQGEADILTKKDLLIRLQAPRFFVQKDEVVLSGNVHNYLKKEKLVTVSLELEGNALAALGETTHKITLAPGGEKRIDWRVRVKSEGEALVRLKALSDEESDAVEMRFPAYVHGMLKMESFSGVLRPGVSSGQIVFSVPRERRPEQTRLEVRYSPTLAGALVDALPYLVDYPYGCTEQTLNRFLPTVITQRVLQRLKLDLKDIQQKRTNLNAAELGDAKERAQGWKRRQREPVFDEAEVRQMSVAGVQALVNMQCSDGGWGWFSGSGERSYPHTTAVVVHGLQIARDNDVTLVPGVLERGIAWLKNYQEEQLRRLKNAASKTVPFKQTADNLDALVHMVLVDANVPSVEMREMLYRDRTQLSVYAKAMFGLALHRQKQAEKLAMILQNCEQYLQEDAENQTAYLKLPAGSFWWRWYDSEVEANAWYLKLLSRTEPKGKRASGLVKYLLNNRKHASYWGSTRDTAYCIEAMADYLKASGEDKPEQTVEVWLDGKKHKEVKIDSKNLFSYDNQLLLQGDALSEGKHTVEIRRQGSGPVYYSAYLSNFTLEDFIGKAGLEIRVQRKYYRLTPVKDAQVKVPGARGQVGEQRVEKYTRTELKSGEKVKSGELVEVELEIDSKNDYEYLLFEDPKAAGFEAVAVRSGYTSNDLGAYMEVRDDRVCYFARTLARGKHSVRYRLRAEIPGSFSALPARVSAMYAPELRGNSDEIKLAIFD